MKITNLRIIQESEIDGFITFDHCEDIIESGYNNFEFDEIIEYKDQLYTIVNIQVTFDTNNDCILSLHVEKRD